MLQSVERKTAPTVSSAGPLVVPTPAALRDLVRGWRAAGETIALVPTMGALHAGHLALVAQAKAAATRTMVSIFVNPAQFAPAEDLDRYPRTFEADCALLASAKVDVVYAPTAADMYPAGFSSRISVGGPATVGLEDAARPHFFGGVATVVAKLLTQAQPDFALFGEKDYQQLQVVGAMVRDLDLPVAIVPVATVRETDGLALSSRNRFLTSDERDRAGAISAALSQAAAAIRSGTAIAAALARGRDTIRDAGCTVEYFEARHAVTLVPIDDAGAGPVRLLAAARLGAVRLIDNMAV